MLLLALFACNELGCVVCSDSSTHSVPVLHQICAFFYVHLLIPFWMIALPAWPQNMVHIAFLLVQLLLAIYLLQLLVSCLLFCEFWWHSFIQEGG